MGATNTEPLVWYDNETGEIIMSELLDIFFYTRSYIEQKRWELIGAL